MFRCLQNKVRLLISSCVRLSRILVKQLFSICCHSTVRKFPNISRFNQIIAASLRHNNTIFENRPVLYFNVDLYYVMRM